MRKVFRDVCKLAISVSLVLASCGLAAFAEQYYDAGLKSFKAKNFTDAARYFEVSIKNAPWESNAFYYCALSYHYLKDYKKAADKYSDCAARFPGTEAGNSAATALKALDPNYQQHKKSEQAADASAAAKAPQFNPAAGASAGASQDKGSIEGQPQTRVFYRINDRDKVVDVRINGHATRAIFDNIGEGTTFSRQQLASLGIALPASTTETKVQVDLGSITRKNFPITVEDTALPARIGNSFLDAFNVEVNDSAKTIDLRRKSGGAAGGAATGIGFTRDGKNLLVSVEINGHTTSMVFDPEASGEMVFTTQQAKSVGLKVDDGDAEQKIAPIRGTEGWVPPEDRPAPAKMLSVRMKLGPIEQHGVACKVVETGGPKKPTFGPDFISSNGYKFEIDYKSNKIALTRK